MNKAQYRSIYKEKRLLLSSNEKERFDQGIFCHLQSFDWSSVSYVHIYISIVKFNEPDTLQFVSYLRDNFPLIKIVLSKSNFEDHTMLNYLWDENLVLEESKWGILEPQSGTLISEDKLDVVIVPLLVCDKKGNRVGYGKGFYDRFLSKCKAATKKIGISYFDPVDSIDDINEWDLPIEVLVTPSVIYSFE